MLLKNLSLAVKMLSEVQVMERTLWTIAYVTDPEQVAGLIAVVLSKGRSLACVDVADSGSRALCTT